MENRREAGWNRRDFLAGMTFAGTAGLLGLVRGAAAPEPPPEVTRIRLAQFPAVCQAGQYMAEEFLRADGFTEVQYIKKEGSVGTYTALASGEADINLHFAGPLVIGVDRGDPVLVMAGSHIGCFELFAIPRIRRVRDLKGRSIAVPGLGSSQHIFSACMLAQAGLDPRKDVKWVVLPSAEAMRLLARGRVDAFLAFPPEPQELRVREIGHVLVSSMMDQPWSRYFCCVVAGNRDFVQKYPVATKKVVRAILQGTEVCSREPERVARYLVEKGHIENYDYAMQVMQDLHYSAWRENDPEDTVRFYARRLLEAGMIENSPRKIIAEGTDWRFLTEIKKEWKG